MLFFLFKQKTAYELRISDWRSDGCSSDLATGLDLGDAGHQGLVGVAGVALHRALLLLELVLADVAVGDRFAHARLGFAAREDRHGQGQADGAALALAIQRTHVGAAPAFAVAVAGAEAERRI